ncbi:MULTISPECIES: hypothetical protein [Dyella]|uniref:hypothetical protein n=1 Tax=Dyella TaxID=231454 RepID=UPI000C81B2CD|nr:MULTISPECIES: hypothetical protein [Dyella]MDR3446941.1 hypothetical protein [Dyella sp.]PMQ04908.1 hypothetical protein DyAD56_12805 [Dyella sp. AD56]ULU26424.1 hypothetical protein DYST_03370 [Dyella terrae]
MSSLFTNLLFLHGHITDPELARRLADTPTPKPRPTGKRERTPNVTATARKGLAPPKLAHDGCG